MTELDKVNWRHGLLGELLPIKYGKSLPGKLRDDSGIHPVFGSSGRVGVHSSPLTIGPTVIIGRKGNVGAIHYSTVPCWPIDTTYYVEAPEGHNLRYYKYLLESLNLATLDRSTAIPGLSRDDYNAIEVVVAPPENQNEIVAEIEKQFSRLDEAVTNLRHVAINLKRYKATILKAAVEGRLVPTEAELAYSENRSYETSAQLLQRILVTRRSQWTSEGRYKEPVAPVVTSQMKIPNGWRWASVDQLALVGTGATPNRGRADYFNDGTVPWVTSAVVNERYVDQPSEFVTAKALAETNLTVYPVGTLIVAMYGEGKTRGKCAELRIPAATNQALAALQVDPAVRGYLRMFLEHNYEETRKVASGGVQPNMNLSLVRALVVPLPPLAEQRRIVSEVDRLLSIIAETDAQVARNLSQAEHLRNAVLSKAFGQDDVERVPSINNGVGLLMKKIKLPLLPAARRSEAEDHRRDLIEVLKGYPAGVSAELLFQEAGYRGDQVDTFYRDLARLSDQIVQVLPDVDGKNWPDSGAVNIQLKT